MNPRLLFSIGLFLCIYSCKKDPAITTPVTLHGTQINSQNPPVPAVVDFRDTVIGNYTGTMRHIRTQFFGADTIMDTILPYTLHVTIDSAATSTANSLWMDGIEMDSDAAYFVHLSYYWGLSHPRQYGFGHFTFFPTYAALYFIHSDSWLGVGDQYTFQGTK